MPFSGLSAPPPLVINWGLGVESSSYLTRVLADPDRFGVDLASTVVVHAVTGNEWPDSLALAEEYLLPRMRAAGLRLVQVARAGQFEKAGIEVLDDTHSPTRIHAAGSWKLSDELSITGTVPQIVSGQRRCSLKYKIWPLTRWIAAEFGDQPYRQVIGYNADEQFRRDRDLKHEARRGRSGRLPEFPVLDWGWGREICDLYLQAEYGTQWAKSACWLCPFPANLEGLPRHLARMRRHPEHAVAALRLEFVATALNPASTLYGAKSLLAEITKDGNTAALASHAADLTRSTWAVYHVRRLIPATKADPSRKGRALRSVRVLHTADREGATAWMRSEAARLKATLVQEGTDHERAWTCTRGETLPAIEAFLVSAPADVMAKERSGFAAAWAAATGELLTAGEGWQLALW